LMGTVPSVIFGGCMTLVVVVVTMWLSPQLRKMREIYSEESFAPRSGEKVPRSGG